jgi:O-antigen/teichoic acid export membrane protein
LGPNLFNIPQALENEFFWCLTIFGCSIGVQLSLFLFSAAFMATQRYDIANMIGIATRLLGAAMVFGAIQFGFGLIGICLATVACDIAGFLARWKIAYWIIPQLAVSRSRASRKEFREMFSYGCWSFLIAIGQSVFTYLDAIVIGALMPIAALAPFALAAGLIRQLEKLLRPIDQVFFPAATELHARKEIEKLRVVYLRGSRLFLVVVSISAVLAGFFAEDFYRLWVGEKYINGTGFPSVALLFQILLIAMIGRLFPGLGAQVLQGSLLVRPLAILTIVEAIANALLSIVLIRYYGLVGVALGTLISVIVIRTFAIPILVGQHLDVPLLVYVRQAALKPITMAVALSLIVVCVRRLGTPAGFGELFAQGALAAVAAAPLALFIGMTRDDRIQVVYKTIHSAWNRVVRREVEQTNL